MKASLKMEVLKMAHTKAQHSPILIKSICSRVSRSLCRNPTTNIFNCQFQGSTRYMVWYLHSYSKHLTVDRRNSLVCDSVREYKGFLKWLESK